MKKSFKHKAGAAAAAVVLIAGIMIGGPFPSQAAAAGSSTGQDISAAGQEEESGQAAKVKSSQAKTSADDADKSEMVYAKADAAGNVYDVSVETILKNRDPAGNKQIEDYSVLKEIKNTEGDEEFSQEGNKLLWDNHGEDISYKGKTDQQLPVAVSITYFLDGKEIKPDQLAGESGALRMRIDYKNTTSEQIQTGGETVTVPVPFAACTILFLPEDHFTNMKVENGRVISMEGNQVVIGAALPGLSECLELEEWEPTEEIEIPEYVEITADVTDFKLDFTATVISSGIFSKLEEEDLKELEEIPGDVEELRDATSKLADGGKELNDGAAEFGSYLTQYISGGGQIGEGISQLTQGLETLSGQSSALTDGAGAVSSGLGELEEALAGIDFSGADMDMAPVTAAANALAADAQTLQTQLQAVQSLTSQLQDFAGQAAAYKSGVDSSVQSAKETLAGLTGTDLSGLEQAAALQAGDQAGAAAADAVRQALEGSGLSEDIIENAAEGARNAAAAGIDLTGITADAQGQITAQAEQASASLDAIPSLEIPQIQAETGDISATITDMQKQLEILSGAAKSMSGLGTQMEQLQTVIGNLKEAVSGLAKGSSALSEGVSAYTKAVSGISDGAAALCEGFGTYSTGGQSLSEGYASMRSGIGLLAEGLQEFDQEAAGELEKMAGDSLKQRITKIKGLRSADLAYDNFAGLADGRTGSVRFIIETDEIK